MEEEGSETGRLGGRRGALLNGERSCIKRRPTTTAREHQEAASRGLFRVRALTANLLTYLLLSFGKLTKWSAVVAALRDVQGSPTAVGLFSRLRLSALLRGLPSRGGV